MTKPNLIRNKWLVLPAALLVGVGLYALFGFWLVPQIIRSQATGYVENTLGKSLALGEIRFNPFTFQVNIRDLRVDDDGTPVLALQRFAADFQASSVWQGAYVFNSVALDSPYARAVIRPDGSINLADLFPKMSNADAELPSVHVRALDVSGGKVDFADLSRRLKPEKTLAPIEFHLKDFRTTPEGGGFKLAAASERDEHFDWTGHLTLRPLASKGRLQVTGLKAETIDAFIGDDLPLLLTAGSFDLGADYDFSVAEQAGAQLELVLPTIIGTGLGLRARGVDTDWVVLPRFTLENTRASLAKQQVEVESVQLDGLQAKVWMNADGSLNVQQLLAAAPTGDTAAAAGPTPVAATAANPPADWKIAVASVQLQNGAMELQDRTVRPAANFNLSPLAFTATGLSQDMARPVPITVEATVNGVAPLKVSGTVVPETVAATLEVDVSRMPLRDVLAYLPQYPTLRLKSGVAAGRGKLHLRPAAAEGAALEFIGDGTVTGFDLREAQGDQQFLSWDRVEAKGLHYTEGPDAIRVKTLVVDGPYARVMVMPDQSINVLAILGDHAATGAAADQQASMDMPISVDSTVLSNGTMSFADYSMEPSFVARIEALRGSVLDISTARDSVATIKLDGHVINKYSPVSISGETSTMAFDRHTDIKMAFRNIELPIFNPYSGRFAGYAISKGKLSTELHYRIDDRALVADHHVVIDQLEWGEETDSKEKVSLPVRLATSLLKDRHGVIDLQLPVTGSLDDPKFKVGPIVWQVLKNIVTKIVVAPFSFLGSMFAGAEEAQFVEFMPGSAALSDQAKSSLAVLATGLAEKPELKLDIPAAAAEADAEALARQRLYAAALGSRRGKDAVDFDSLDAGDQAGLLEDLYKQQMGRKAEPPDIAEAADDLTRKQKRNERDKAHVAWLEAQLLPRYAVAEADLTGLGQARAATIQEALLAAGTLDPTRVFVATGEPATATNERVRLELQLR